MATVYRKTVTRPLPANAEIIIRKGERIAKWKAKNGERQTGVVSEAADGTLRVRVLSAYFIAKYRDGSGKVQEVSTGCRSKDAALSVLKQLTGRAELVKSGVVSAADDAVRDWLPTPIADCVNDYLAAHRSRGCSPNTLAGVEIRLQRLIRECPLVRLRDLTASAIEGWLNEREAEGLSPRTRNSYLEVAKAFGNWCVKAKRLATNPLAELSKVNQETDRRLQRRAMTGEELQRLLYVATWRPLAEFGRESIACDETERAGKRSNWTKAPLTFDTLTEALDRARHALRDNPEFISQLEARGRERALVYKALVLTGLRRGELASLTVGSLQLDGPQAFAILEAGNAKNRQRAEIPIRSDLAADLRQWLVEKRKAMRVYCSSDHVVGGDAGPYDEGAATAPISVYGRTRVDAEQLVLARPNTLVVRSGLWIGPSATGRIGHLDWLRHRHRHGLPMTVVSDEVRSAVWAEDAARRVWELCAP